MTALLELQRDRARLEAAEASLLAAIKADPTPHDTLREVMLEKGYVAEEVALALRVASRTAADRIAVADELVHRLPATHAAMAEGRLPGFFARHLVHETAGLSDELVTGIEAAVLDDALDDTDDQDAARGGQSYGAFRRAVAKAVLACDPRSADQRHETAMDERRAAVNPERDGMAWFNALLPAHAAQALWNRVSDAARRSKTHRAAGDDRTMDQRRADVLTDLALTGSLGHSATGTTGTTGTPSPAVATSTGGVEIRVCVAMSTLLGIDDRPGELDGYGPIPATLARNIAFGRNTVWRRLVTDDLGHLIDYGTKRYRPPKALDRHVRARDQHCRAYGCHRRAVTTELDHLIPFSRGGPTNKQNLHPLCARDHDVKHDAGWQVSKTPDGTTAWTTPSGITRTVPAATYPIDTTSQLQTRPVRILVDQWWPRAA